jgi:RNA polymerase sigma-70 factor (ECF subfamily)
MTPTDRDDHQPKESMSGAEQDFEPYRPLLFSIAYRMLGSAMEAEDMVQEAFLRYQRVNAADIDSPKAYLTTVITRLCLDQLKSAKAQREQYVGIWLPEPLLTTAGSESPGASYAQRESISMAFLRVLEQLSPVERAVFLLREVFDYPYSEIARIVGKSEVNCRRYYHNAKQDLLENRPRFEPSSDEHRALIESFLQAISTGDLDKLTDLLAEDVIVYGDGGGKVPTSPRPIVGREMAVRIYRGIARFIPEGAAVLIAEVNGSPSIVVRVDGQVLGILNFSIANGQIQTVHHLFNIDKLGTVSDVLEE